MKLNGSLLNKKGRDKRLSVKQADKHVHKFRRLRYKSGNEIFFCVLPDCNQKISIPLALGKRSLCWRCGQPFIMTEYSLRLAKPHCDNCHKPKKDIHTSTEISENEAVKQFMTPLSLAERLEQEIHSRQIQETEMDEEI